MKPSDLWTVPMCNSHHVESHEGERTFEAKYKVDLRAIAATLAAASPYIPKG